MFLPNEPRRNFSRQLRLLWPGSSPAVFRGVFRGADPVQPCRATHVKAPYGRSFRPGASGLGPRCFIGPDEVHLTPTVHGLQPREFGGDAVWSIPLRVGKRGPSYHLHVWRRGPAPTMSLVWAAPVSPASSWSGGIAEMAHRRLALIVPPETSVRQILETEREIGNPANVWHDVTDQPQVGVGWLFDGSEFREPHHRLSHRLLFHVNQPLPSCASNSRKSPRASTGSKEPNHDRVVAPHSRDPAVVLRDPARAALVMFRARGPHAFVGRVVGNGHCVAFVREAAFVPHTSKWRRGTKARGGELPNGTAIATFDPVSHRYTNSVDGRSHAAIFLREDPEGLRVLDQWVGRPVGPRLIRFAPGANTRPVNDGDAYYVIEVRK